MSIQTRKRAQDLAKKICYHPNAAARSLHESGTSRRPPMFHGKLAYILSPHEDLQMRQRGGQETYPWHADISLRPTERHRIQSSNRSAVASVGRQKAVAHQLEDEGRILLGVILM
ncbi:MAG: hypothetical protein SFU85_12495 [Candidatus Methylacidiphilales bacterium]|nr:hypothetical protein [Candidatus Methylacidiphilales bacterium]